MPEAHLNEHFPHLAVAWRDRARLLPRYAAVNLADRPLGVRLLCDRDSFAVPALRRADDCILSLTAAGRDLTEQLRFLVSRQERDFVTGLDEIFSFQYLQRLGILVDVGFGPKDNGSPALDCSIRCPGGQVVGVDVKTAGATAFDLLERALKAGSADWEGRHGRRIGGFDFEVAGPVTQQVVGAQHAHISAAWRDFLATEGPELPTRRIAIRISPKLVVVVGGRASGGSMRGTSGVSIQAQVAFDTLRGHVESKSAHGLPFLLLYVRQHMSPIVDLAPEPLRGALARLHRRLSIERSRAHALWLGAVYLDLARGVESPSLYARANADWPERADVRRIHAALGATRWVTRRRSR